MFDSYKSFPDAYKMYRQNRNVLEGCLLANFIAMIAYYRLFTRLKKADLMDKFYPKDIIEISKAIFQLKTKGQ